MARTNIQISSSNRINCLLVRARSGFPDKPEDVETDIDRLKWRVASPLEQLIMQRLLMRFLRPL